MTLCKSYMTTQGFCQYGVRCQFCHLSRDFSDFDQQTTRYQNLLHENAKIMQSRIDQVADPDISQFNIAMPKKARLAIFESVCPDTSEKESKQVNQKSKSTKQKAGQKKQRNAKNHKKVTFIKRQKDISESMKLSNAHGLQCAIQYKDEFSGSPDAFLVSL